MKPLYVRVRDICKDDRNDTRWLLPISKSQWWEGVRTGKFPQAIKLGPRTTVWRFEDVEQLKESLPKIMEEDS
jgi:predicted DNA-binding transcriptional regulator AlpA